MKEVRLVIKLADVDLSMSPSWLPLFGLVLDYSRLFKHALILLKFPMLERSVIVPSDSGHIIKVLKDCIGVALTVLEDIVLSAADYRFSLMAWHCQNVRLSMVSALFRPS